MMSYATYTRAEDLPILTGKVHGGKISIALTPNLPQEITEGGLKTASLFVAPAVSTLQTGSNRPALPPASSSSSVSSSGSGTPTSSVPATAAIATYYNIPKSCSHHQAVSSPVRTPDTDLSTPHLYAAVASPTASSARTIVLRRTPSTSSDITPLGSHRITEARVIRSDSTPSGGHYGSSPAGTPTYGAGPHSASAPNSRSNSIDQPIYGPLSLPLAIPVEQKIRTEITLEEFMSFFTQVAKITDHLYLCAAAGVTPANIKANGITNVINLTVDVPALNPNVVETMRVSIDDIPGANLGAYFDQLTDRIRRVKERGGRTLVHCVAGVSRSASTCIAYLMKYYRMPLLDAYRYVKSRRSVIRPNAGFFKQLIDFEWRLFGTNTVRMVDSTMGVIPDVYREEVRGMVAFHNVGAGAPRVRRAVYR